MLVSNLAVKHRVGKEGVVIWVVENEIRYSY